MSIRQRKNVDYFFNSMTLCCQRQKSVPLCPTAPQHDSAPQKALCDQSYARSKARPGCPPDRVCEQSGRPSESDRRSRSSYTPMPSRRTAPGRHGLADHHRHQASSRSIISSRSSSAGGNVLHRSCSARSLHMNRSAIILAEVMARKMPNSFRSEPGSIAWAVRAPSGANHMLVSTMATIPAMLT